MKKILIIEDEKMLREMYVQKFQQAGFEAMGIGEAEGALEVAKKEMPDFILLDILLPRENGISLLKKIRRDPQLSSIKIVAFSNYDSPQAKKEAQKLNVEAYLLKANFTPKEIVKKVREYLK